MRISAAPYSAATGAEFRHISVGARWPDLLFAVTTVVGLSGWNIPGTGAPLFLLFACLTATVCFRSMLRIRVIGRLLVPPLFAFMCVHLAFAFRISVENGVLFVLQAVMVGLFLWAFLSRYTDTPMNRYLLYSGIGLTLLLFYVVIYHLLQGRYTSYKLLDDPKAVFNLLPIILLALRFSRRRHAKLALSIAMPLFILLIMLSGERKAYILLAVVAPFLFNLRSWRTYVAVLLIVVALPLTAALDKYGYVQRQVGTLTAFTQGTVDSTTSNELRAWAIRYARQLFEQSPVIGVGTNGYAAAVEKEFHGRSGTHSEWMRVAAENGLVGLFLYGSTVIWGLAGLFRRRVGRRIRGFEERILGGALFLTLLIYLSFEALDFIVLLSFCLIPMIQFLNLHPGNDPSFGRGKYPPDLPRPRTT